MRDFIFRGYDKEEDGWVTGFLACEGSRAYVNGHEVDPASVGQYTGFYDADGQPVFEGDIITGLHRYGVVWNALQGCYKLLRLGEQYECTSFATKMKTIIGNLYELKDGTLKEKIYGKK